MLEKIISAAQTGADRAALDAALEKDFPSGGSCLSGWLAEDNSIDRCYPLEEMVGGYEARTKKNVDESDGTLIFL